jgi:hypothetical protein
MMNLQEILVVENDPTFLDFKCPKTGYLLWPLIRQEFIQFITSDLLYKSAPLISLNRSIAYPKALPSLLKAEYHNLVTSRRAKGNVLLMASGAGLFLKDGKWFNRLSDYFAFVSPSETLVLEDFFNWHVPYPRHNQKIIYHAPIQTSLALKGRLSLNQSHIHLGKEIVRYFRDRAKEILDWELSANDTVSFEHRMAKKIAELPFRKQTYENFLTRKNTKLVIKEEGCYGHSSILNRVARELGIVVAEYQHGTISAGHDAYNVAPKLLSSQAYSDTLPQHFLSYGEWWHQYLKLPVNKIAIGNPHRSSQITRLSSLANKADVLVLGDGIETELYIDLAIFLAQNLDSFRVVFRPHPLERVKLQDLLVNKSLGNVVIDKNSDIYDSFCNAHVVVNEVSTGLFEAVGLADRVLIWDTPKSKFYYPMHPFASFVDSNDLLEKIKDGKTGSLDTKGVHSVWAEGWEENYKNFLVEHSKNTSLELVK